MGVGDGGGVLGRIFCTMRGHGTYRRKILRLGPKGLDERIFLTEIDKAQLAIWNGSTA